MATGWPAGSVPPAVSAPLVQSAAPVRPPPRSFHVAPDGRPTHPGTRERPLDLATALSAESPAGPGDTIWLHGGTYRGTFISALRGTPDAPIVVRQMPGERATIDASPSNKDALFVNGAWTWYWGFEVFSSEPNRISKVPGATDIQRAGGVVSHAPGAKFINLIIHDMLGGMGVWASSPDAEVYGSLIYHNGYLGADRGHGHGIYAQNRHGRQQYIDNVLFGGFSHGIHIYGSDQAYLNNMHVEGNIIFNSGVLASYFDRNLLVGGGRVAENPTLVGNYTYYDESLEKPGGENNLGFSAGCANLVVRDNYWAHIRKYPLVLPNCTGIIERNVFLGWTNQETQARYPSNTFLTAAPSGIVTFVRPNRYEPGRANVVIYNWDGHAEVSIDLRAARLRDGQAFEVRDVQNFFGPPVATGTYTNGARIQIPMTLTDAVRPIGNVPTVPAHTPRTFGAFIVLPRQ